MKTAGKTAERVSVTAVMKQVMKDYFLEMDDATRMGEKKIAWCTSVGPAELLRGLGFLVYFPENHGAMLGSTRMAADLIPTANALGFSPDICSYLTSDIGSFLSGETPLKRAYDMAIPLPDVLVFNTNQCRDVKDWFSWYARHLGKPLVGIHTHRHIGKIPDHALSDISLQMEEMVLELEAVSGNRLKKDRLEEAVALSRECSELWEACLRTAIHHPSPWTFFDHTIFMGPAVVLRGTQTAVDFYRMLLEDLQLKIENEVASVTPEDHRIYWEGMPIWGRLRMMADLFDSLNTCVAASTYCNSWVFTQLDASDPFRSMARAYTELFIVRDEAYKESYLEKMAADYRIDGFLFHDAKTCPNNSNNRYGLPERLGERLGKPVLTINGDLNDLRLFSEQQSITNIEAFIEQIEEMKR